MKFIIPVLVASILIGAGGILHKVQSGSTEPEKSEAKTQLTFSSFDGGGPEFDVVLDSEIVTYDCVRKYHKADHEKISGAGYDVIYTFTGLTPGETKMTIEERSPIAGNFDHIYTVKVDDNLNVKIEELSEEDLAAEPMPVLVVRANGKVYYAKLEDNPSAQAFAEKLSSQAVSIDMHDYNNFEKVGSLPWELPTNDEPLTTSPGDIVLYQGDRITIYYGQNTWDLTRLARIDNVSEEELLETLGKDDVTVGFEIEWSE